MKTYDARTPGTPLNAVKPGDYVIMDSGVYRVYNDGNRWRFWGADEEYALHEAARELEQLDYRQTVDAASYRGQ